MSNIKNIKWQSTCCAWHGEYAEHPTRDGGIARLKRSPDSEKIRIVRFDSNNRPVDVDGDGVPDYTDMTTEELEAILA